MASKETLKTNITYSYGHREGKREGYAKGYDSALFNIKSKIITFCVRVIGWALIAITTFLFCYSAFMATKLSTFFSAFAILIIPFGILLFLYIVDSKKMRTIIKTVACGLVLMLIMFSLIGLIIAFKQ